MPSIAEKDAFPTPDMNDRQGEQVVWAGPGLNVLEYTTIRMAASLATNLGNAIDDDTIALMAYKLARAVIRRLDANHEEELPEAEA